MTPNRPEHANRTQPVKGALGFTIRRVLTGYGYPVNGNVHNPTPRYLWLLLLNGRVVDQHNQRGHLIEAARQLNAAQLYSETP